MTRQAVRENYPMAVPEGFLLLREYDPELGMTYFRARFQATLEQAVTDELLGAAGISSDLLWNSTIRELESSLKRRFR